MSRRGYNSDYSQGERDYEQRRHPDYERDRYGAGYGTPDRDYFDGYDHARREEERRQEEREEEERAERRAHDRRMEEQAAMMADMMAEEEQRIEYLRMAQMDPGPCPEPEPEPDPEPENPEEASHEDRD